MGAGGHDPFFGADDLSGRQLMAPGAVGAARLDGGLEQLYGGSLLYQSWGLLYYIPPPFSTVFLYRQSGEGQKDQPHAPGGRGGEGERLWKSIWAMASVCSAR